MLVGKENTASRHVGSLTERGLEGIRTLISRNDLQILSAFLNFEKSLIAKFVGGPWKKTRLSMEKENA